MASGPPRQINERSPNPNREDMARKKLKTDPPMQPQILLPSDVVSDILSRLPVKTLARFRCVCREWYSLTYDSYFVNTHHERALKDRRGFVNTVLVENIMTHCEFDGDGKLKETSFEIDLGEDPRVCHLSNFVNGLTCAISREDDTVRWLLNPTTRELVQLPAACDRSCFSDLLGLGFDGSTREYKVVRLLSWSTKESAELEILTVGTQEWRYVGKVPSCLWVVLPEPVFLHGVLYWGALQRGGGSLKLRSVILTFDVKNEKVESVIPGPQASRIVALKECGGCLCAVVDHFLPNLLEMWTLNDCGSRQWTKVCSVNVNILCCGFGLPFIVDTSEENIIFQRCNLMSSDIYSYDLQTKMFSKIYHRIGGRFHVAAHVEGLVSPRKIVNGA